MKKPQQLGLPGMPAEQPQEALSGKRVKKRFYYVGSADGDRMLYMGDATPGYYWGDLSFVESGPALFNSFKEARRVANCFKGKVRILPYDRYRLLCWWNGTGPAY